MATVCLKVEQYRVLPLFWGSKSNPPSWEQEAIKLRSNTYQSDNEIQSIQLRRYIDQVCHRCLHFDMRVSSRLQYIQDKRGKKEKSTLMELATQIFIMEDPDSLTFTWSRAHLEHCK